MKYAGLVAFTAVLLFPLYWMFSGSLQDITGIMRVPPALIPTSVTLENYRILVRNSHLARWCANSALIFGMVVGISLTTSALAGYAFAMFRFRGKQVLWWAFLAAIMIPRQTLLIPLYVTVKNLGIAGTYWAAAFPIVFSPVGIFLASKFFQNIPQDIVDCARIDGAGELGVVARIVVPLCKPLFGALAIFAGIGSLADYLWQNLVLQDRGKWTIVVGIVNTVYGTRGGASEMNLNPIGLSLAGGVLMFLPMLAIFVAFQRYFVDGIVTGGVKE